jgi:hypothetical protein
MTLLTKIQGKRKPTAKHAPCAENITDEELVKSAMNLNDSEKVFLFVAWYSNEDIMHITIFSEVLSIDTNYGTN